MPPNAAPIEYASSFVFTSGMPIDTAATSSSRSATQARPSRESRKRRLTNSTTSRMAKISQYHGLRFSRLNDPIPGKYGWSTALMPRLPAVSVMPPPTWTLWPFTATTPMISPNASVTIAM